MKTFEEQLRKIIIDNTPKNIELSLPVGKDIELREILSQICNEINKVNSKVDKIEGYVKSIIVDLKINSRRDNYNKYWG